MLIIDLMILLLLVFSVILLSGVKIIYKPKYSRLILFLLVIYNPFSELIKDYKLGYTGISSIIMFSLLFLLIFIWGYKRNKYIYEIHNVKQNDVINIIGNYLEMKNIKYEVIDDEIYLPQLYKSVFISGSMGITLNCRDIKDVEFYDELVENIRIGIKEIKQRYLPIEGMFNLVFIGIFYWIRFSFLVDFLK